MTVRYLHNRPPREKPLLPELEIEIARPSTSSGGKYPVYKIAIPILVTVLGIAFLTLGGTNPSSYMFMIIFMGGTYVVSFMDYLQNKEKGEGAEKRYEKYLTGIEATLQNRVADQLSFRSSANPDFSACSKELEERTGRLWERRPADDDFLNVRIGTGSEPLAAKFRLPGIDPAGEENPLLSKAHELVKDYGRRINGVPILLPLRTAQIVGVVGGQEESASFMRGFITSLATFHSPDEVKLAAFLPPGSMEEWKWLRWLPHCWDNSYTSRQIAGDASECSELLEELAGEISSRTAKNEDAVARKPILHAPTFIVLIADQQIQKNSNYTKLLQEGPEAGFYVISLTANERALPSTARFIIDLQGTQGQLKELESDTSRGFKLDPVIYPTQADWFARHAAQISPSSHGGLTEIPAKVGLLEVLGASTVEELGIWERWQSCRPEESLSVAIGKTYGGQLFHLDLHENGHGPHGMGAGMTRLGKTVLLRSLILSLAVNYHPDLLSFLLIDFKGGDMTMGLEDLPHVVGVFTNIKGDIKDLAKRAASAIQSELDKRQRLFAKANVNHIDRYISEYRKGKVSNPLPHLIIIIDEYKELVDAFKKLPGSLPGGLANVATVGGSLGVHLLATSQKPEGKVSEDIKANVSFKFALKTASPQDSREILSSDAAFFIPKSRKGRGYIRFGESALSEFQSAHDKEPFIPEELQQELDREIYSIDLRGQRTVLNPKNAGELPTQKEMVVNEILRVANKHNVHRRSELWHEPLPEKVLLASLRGTKRGWEGSAWVDPSPEVAPVIGLIDDPGNQKQEALEIDFARYPNVIVFGGPQTGKSTALQTMLISLALDQTPEDLSIYVFDFGTGRFASLAALPHVGGVVTQSENDRVIRLIQYLQMENEFRKKAVTRAGYEDLRSYNQDAKDKLPRIFVFVDNLPNLLKEYENLERTFANLLAEGGSLGMHFVLSANSPKAIRASISDTIPLTFALRLEDSLDYSLAQIGYREDIKEKKLPKGRAYVNYPEPLDVQFAMPSEASLDPTQVRRSYAGMGTWAGKKPYQILETPDRIQLSSIIETKGDSANEVPVGVHFQDLTPFLLAVARPILLITGTEGSGKTTLLRTILFSIAYHLNPGQARFYIVDFYGRAMLPDLPHAELIRSSAELSLILLPNLRQKKTNEEGNKSKSRKYIVIDDYHLHDGMLNASVQSNLEAKLWDSGEASTLILATRIEDLANGTSTLYKYAKTTSTSFLLGSASQNHFRVLGQYSVSGSHDAGLARGEGYWLQQNSRAKIKAASTEGEEPAFTEIIKNKYREFETLDAHPGRVAPVLERASSAADRSARGKASAKKDSKASISKSKKTNKKNTKKKRGTS